MPSRRRRPRPTASGFGRGEDHPRRGRPVSTLAAELARIAEHRPATAEEVEAGRAAHLRRYGAPRRPPPVSTLTGRPTPRLADHLAELGPLPLDPGAALVEHRRRRALLARP